MTVIVQPVTVVEIYIDEICEGESVNYFGQTYNQSGVYTLNPYDGIHCDSIILLDLNVIDTFYSESYATICQGEEYYFHGQSFTEAGSHPVVFPNSQGCDSTYMLHLTVNPSYSDTITTSICDGEFYDFHGDMISTSGTYDIAFQTIQGCDSLFTLHLTVHPTAETLLNEEICDGEVYHVGFSTYDSSGSYIDTLWTSLGCDSVVHLNLTVHPLFETVLNEEICEGDSYNVGTSVYSTSGTFTDILPDVNGCDSTIILNLTVHPLFETVLNEEICDGDSYTVGTSVYTISGTYTDILPDINGCDSTLILNLTVHPLFETVLNEEICDGDSYTVGSSIYTTSGTYTDILPDVNGCDSTVILTLTVHPLFETVLNEEICDGDTYTVGTSVYTTTGNYTDILQDVNGCDSTIILNLLVNPLSPTIQLVEICDGESFSVGTSTYNIAGAYMDVLLDVNGCDSTVITVLIVHPLLETLLNEEICDGDSYSVGSSVYTTSGTYTDILTDVNGCDSTVILNLTVHPLFETVLNEEICDGDSYTVGSSIYTTSGTYTDILPDVNGCDSTIILNLAVHPLFETLLNEEICDGDSYTVGSSIYTNSGTYTDILPDVNGCDSTIILNLAVHPLFETVLNEEICDGDSYTVGTSIYTTSGTYTDILPDINGCDSTVILNLTVHPLFETLLNEEICDGDSYTVGSSIYTTSGTYTDILPDVNGCDSTIILNLTVHPLSESLLNEEICDGDSYTVGSSIYTTSGTYTDILPDVNGCDSTVILTLTVHPLFETVLNEEICDGDSYTVGTSVYNTTGTYTNILPDVNGCDSTVILTLTVHPLFETVLNEEICNGDSYTVGSSIYTTSGTYTDILPDVNGCDSTVILTLTVHPLFETMLNEEICDGDSYTVGTSFYTTSGIYTDILPDVNGCDYDHFEFNSSGDFYTVSTSIYTTSGTYTDILPDVNGCDSTIILTLTVHPLFETVLNEEICDGDSYTVGTSIYTSSGTYTDFGCKWVRFNNHLNLAFT
ncbi:MAG: hypothetical protein IPI60_14340 [Saprospiraceae bacterium]|nr:hypothetical protein [Saprospiraceae bacterium]